MPMHIALELPVGERLLVDVPDGTRALSWPMRVTNKLVLSGVPASVPPVDIRIARPSGDYIYEITDDGVAAVELWRLD